MNTKSLATVAVAVTALAAAAGGGLAYAAQDRSTLKVPDGLALSEFKGYETWQGVAVSQTKEELKLIVAKSHHDRGLQEGPPAKGRLFPDGSKTVKIEWTPKTNAAAPYAVQAPGDLKAIAVIEKDLMRFPPRPTAGPTPCSPTIPRPRP